ncbi:hypothetical protein [Novosphingobium indicum]|uniref:hypothetical protein n=1 Tax=Novosphingobium indicum TaxID=462949 RepID=UPI001E54E881|nr:hypothetical protein [Novosphingobium indicum]
MVKLVLEFIGLSTIADDSTNAEKVAANLAIWVLQQPWWVSALFALSWTAILGYLVVKNVTYGSDAIELSRDLRSTTSLLNALKRGAILYGDLNAVNQLIHNNNSITTTTTERMNAAPKQNDYERYRIQGGVRETTQKCLELVNNNLRFRHDDFINVEELIEAVSKIHPDQEYNRLYEKTLQITSLVNRQLLKAREALEAEIRSNNTVISEYRMPR